MPNWKDVSPRLGASLDLFGNGKTAVKGSIGRYLGGGALSLFTRVADPVTSAVATATRVWNDTNGDLSRQLHVRPIPLANGECLQLSDLEFGGSRILTRYDDSVTNGFGVRNNNWETSGSIQHELLSGLSVSGALLPPLVRQHPGHRQSRRRAFRLQHLLHHRAG